METVEVITDTESIWSWLPGVGRLHLGNYARHLTDMVDWCSSVLRLLPIVDDRVWRI